MPKGVYNHGKRSIEAINKTKETIKNNGGAWNKGLSRETSESVRKQADKLIGHRVSAETRYKIKLNNRARDLDVRAKMSLAHIGKKNSDSARRKQSEALRGSKSHLWRGGITPENHRLRSSVEYKLWRESVFKRDSFTCVWCGDNRGGNLNADHIKPFAFYPELRFAIDNGRTLCVPCHKTTETYLNRNNPYENK